MNTVWVDSDNVHQLNNHKKERKKENDQKLAIIQN